MPLTPDLHDMCEVYRNPSIDGRKRLVTVFSVQNIIGLYCFFFICRESCCFANLRAANSPGSDSDSSDCTESSISSHCSNACVSNILDSGLCPQLFCHEVDALSLTTSFDSSSDYDSI